MVRANEQIHSKKRFHQDCLRKLHHKMQLSIQSAPLFEEPNNNCKRNAIHDTGSPQKIKQLKQAISERQCLHSPTKK
ncbi:jg19660 [Pararge aegeria aegeria]|uniref:Jg19660 protein n=1 Tax=Pararge aegeria aegeria TaxID=348720 RepID=A0A8S4S103_9NEOP|nr:jg19660 [Pararge aegeria aegeria]